LKLRIDLDGESCTLNLQANGANTEYKLEGAIAGSGIASVAELQAGVFSVLLGARSFTVHIAPKGEELEVWVAGQRHIISVTDARDATRNKKKASAAGPVEIRAQMPGKVIKLLTELGASVTAGQGIIVVEAMKMQNEMKAPKDGVVSRILAAEGATVAAGETLIVVE